MRLRQDLKKERSQHAFEITTGMALRKETTSSRPNFHVAKRKQMISNWSRNLHEDIKLDMMSQHEREVVTRDQNG